MTKRKPKSTVKFYDTELEDGFPARVIVPPGGNPQEGIPIHLNLDAIYGHLPDEFQKTLYAALHDRGLVEPADFLTPQAANLLKSALMSVIRYEILKIQNLAREETTHG